MKDSDRVLLTRLVLTLSDAELPLPNRFCCEIEALMMIFSELEKPAPNIRLPVGRSLTEKLTSTWSVVPGTDGVSTLTSSKKPRRSTRVRERLILEASYQPLSIWRISRRTTSSRVRVLPLTSIRRTYTRRPGSTKIVNATSRLSRSTSGEALTLAKA